MAVAEPALLLPVRRRLNYWSLGRLEKFGIAALVVMTLVCIAAPLLAPHSPTAPIGRPFASPGSGALLGTDDLGRDLLSRVLFGMRASWFTALGVVASGVLIGSIIGTTAGVAGGRVDAVLMRITDAGLALPGPMLAIAVVIAIGRGLLHTAIAVALVWWPWYARIVRGETRALVVRPHFDAARTAGSHGILLAWRHVLPGIYPVLLVVASLDLGALILTLAGLSFLGLGASPPAPELGAMTAQELQYLFTDAWVPLVPACAVLLLTLAANLAGDGLRDLLEDV